MCTTRIYNNLHQVNPKDGKPNIFFNLNFKTKGPTWDSQYRSRSCLLEGGEH